MNLNDDHPDDGIIEDDRMNADSDWEVTFIANLKERRGRMGGNFSLSDRERELVLKIGGNLEVNWLCSKCHGIEHRS